MRRFVRLVYCVLLISRTASAAMQAPAPRPPRPHLGLDHAQTSDMLYKWRPIAHDGQLLSDPQRYARARIVLQRRNETRGLVDEDMNLYVVACTPRSTTLVVVLWASCQPEKLAHFRALRAWHTEHLPRRALLGAHHLVDEDERKAWWASTVW